MGGMHIDPKELPLSMQEQVGVKIVAQLAQAAPVAGCDERSPVIVTVRKLIFPERWALCRYYALKMIQKEGMITRPVPVTTGARVTGIEYRILREDIFAPRSSNYIRTDNGILEVFYRG